MAEETLSDEIKLGLDASGVEDGVRNARKSIEGLDDAVKKMGKSGDDGFKKLGKSGEDARSSLDRVTRNMVSSLQRQIAAAEAGGTATRQYQESLARLRGANVDVLKPYLDQLDAAKSKTESAKAAVGDLSSAASSLGRVLGGLAVGALGFFSLRTFIDETIQAEEQQAQLAAVLKSTGEIAGWSQDQLNRMATEMSQVTKFSAGDINQAQTRLLSYTNIVGEQVPRAMRAVTDMATRLGMDLNSAAEQVGKAIDVPSKGLASLSRQGFKFSDDQKAVIESLEQSGRVMEAQGLVLEELESSYGGAAKAGRDTFGGSLAGLKNTLNDLLTGSGGSLEGATESVNTLASTLSSPEVASAFGTITSLIAETINKLASATTHFINFGKFAGEALAQFLHGSADPVERIGEKISGLEADLKNLDAEIAKPRRFSGRGYDSLDELKARAESTRKELNSLRKTQQDLIQESLKSPLSSPVSAPDRPYKPPQAIVDSKAVKKAVDEAAKSAKAAQKEFDNLFTSLTNKEVGLDPKFQEQLLILNRGWKEGAISLEQYQQAVTQLINTQEFAKNSVKRQQAAYEDFIKTIQGASDASAKQEKAARDMLDSIQFETRSLKMTNSERRVAMALRQMETQGIKEGTEAYDEYAEAIRAAVLDNNATQEAIDRQKQIEQGQLDIWKSIDSTAHDVFVNIFEDGAGTFKRLGDTLKASVLDMLYQLTFKRWIINIGANLTGLSLDTVSQALGGGPVGSGVLNNASTGLSLANLYSSGGASLGGSYYSMANALGFGAGSYGAGAGTLGLANGVGAVGGDALGTFIAANGSWSGAGASAGISSGAAAAGVLAVPLLVGMLAGYLDKGDSFSGAAYATSGGNDPVTRVIEGALNPNMNTGDLPDRDALLARLRELGAPDSSLGVNDRTLHRMMLLGEAEAQSSREGGPYMNWGEWSRNNAGLSDFYRGPGYAFAEDLGWWEVQDKGRNYRDWDSFYTDPAVTEVSRKLSEAILQPFMSISDALGMDSSFKAATGMAYNDKTGNIWGGLQLWKNDESILNWGKRDFGNQGEFFREAFSDVLGTFDQFDLPQWADDQVSSAIDALGKLDAGEKLGEEAAQVFQIATDGLVKIFGDIELIREALPGFSEASQDTVFSLGQLMGSLENLNASYFSYLQNFSTEEEKRQMAMEGINRVLDDVGLSVDELTSRDDFKSWVDNALAALDTEEGREAFNALMKVQGAFAELVPPVESVTEALSDVQAAAIQAAQGIGNELQSSILSVMMGTFNGEDAGAFIAQSVMDGIYSSIAGTFATQISDIIVQGVVSPVLTAAATASTASAAVSAASAAVSQEVIANMVAQANAVAQVASELFSNPEFQEALKNIQSSVSNIQVPVIRTPPVAPINRYNDAIRNTGSSAERAADALKKSQDAAYFSLQKSINAEKERLNISLEAAQTFVDTTRNLFDFLTDQVQDLYGEVEGTADMQASMGRSFIEESLSALRDSGALPDQSLLEDAVSAIRNQMNNANFATQFDQDFARLVLAGQLDALKGGAEEQLTGAEQQVQLLEETLTRWDEALDLAQQQLDALQGNKDVTLSLAQAIAGWSKFGNLGDLPSFDVGTNFVPRDMVANIHKGERIFTSEENAALLGILRGSSSGDLQAAVLAELRALRDDNRVQAAEIVKLQSTIARLMDKWDIDGQPPVRT